MQKLHSIATISNAAMPSDLKSYLAFVNKKLSHLANKKVSQL